ncbi:hypothetical protein SAMN05443377_10439 [Propionibacterium cyclohexanicum]|uniref:Phosphodiesterase n=1 Tax=Propionibacterium cyclohexanicum TaxID=64702 RepID=A0A1H9QPF2_9ACTN|nr:DUF5998 family protein [Propionibacterium cyclohexanicum]SER62328.1 hypothetical protein SAMN05443377_10439 [Propionibacterium cyclohexanicum]
MTTAPVSNLPDDLVRWINDCGFFPQLVVDAVEQSLAGEEVADFVVQHEAVVATDEILRHLTVLVLTANRLLVVHTDEQSDERGQNMAVTSTESVPLDLIGVVSLSRAVSNPERYGTDASIIREIVLTIGWGAVRHFEIVPAHCSDPECQAEHGFDADEVNEDITMRMSPTADDPASVARLEGFATRLQREVPARRLQR